MGKFNIDLAKIDNEAFKRARIHSPADELTQGVDPGQQLDDSVAKAVYKSDLGKLGSDETQQAAMEQQQAAQDLNALLQDENAATVSAHIAGNVEQQSTNAGTAAQDPTKYKAVGQQLGEQFGQSGTTAQGEQVAWTNPQLAADEDGVGIGPLANPRAPSIQGQRTQEGFRQVRTTDSTSWINVFDDVKFAEGRDIQNKSQSLDKFKVMGDQTMVAAQDLNYRLRGDNAVAFAERLGQDLGIDYSRPVVQQYLAGFAQNFAQLEESGVSQQLVDIMVAARLQAMKNQEGTDRRRLAEDSNDSREAGYDAAVQYGEQPVSQAKQRELNSENDENVGRVINKAIGVQGDPEIDAIAGAIARGITQKALGSMFEPRMKHIGKARDGTRRVYNSIGLTPQGLAQTNEIESFLNIVLPGSSKVPRNTPKLDKSRISHPRKYDPSKAYGDFDFVNATLDVLDNTPYSMNFSQAGELSTHNSMRILSLDPSFDAILKIKIDPKTGQEREFLVDDNGEYVIDQFGEPKPYIANDLKRSLFDAELAFAEDSNGKNVFFDHFFGGNNRFYVDSAIGNYQSGKIARSLLEAGKTFKYSLSNKNHRDAAKAGIMKKFGFDTHNVASAVNIFDGSTADVNIRDWQNWFATDESIQANAAAINAVANEHEGPMSISAMVEAVKLQNALDAGTDAYYSKFMTEVDGVANGVGHNVLQAGGNLRIEKAANLFSAEALTDLKKGPWKRGEDVYTITADKVVELVEAFQGKPENQPAVNWILNNFVDADGNSMINRNFGKKPMMIFGYGAGGNLIISTANDSVKEMIDANPQLQASMDTNDITITDITDIIGSATEQAVQTEFGAVRKFNQAMSELAAFAVSRGIDPIITLNTGHKINLGLYERKMDTDIGFVDVDGTETAVRRDTIDPEGKENGRLKAAAQSGVLGTHANDGINVGMTMVAMDNKLADGNSAAQIFDGIMMPSLLAPEYAQQLNNDFYQLNHDFSAALQLMEAIERRIGRNARIPTKLRRQVMNIDNMRKQLFKRMKSEQVKQFFWD